MLNGPGDGAVARSEFPGLWKRFVQVASERGVALSSSGYGPTSASEDGPPELPTAIFVEPGSTQEKADVVLFWKPEGSKEAPIEDYWNVRAFPAYSVNGQESGHGPGGFLATLKALHAVPHGSRLRVLNWPAWPLSGKDVGPWMYLFPLEFRKLVAAKRFQLVIECPKNQWPTSANCPAGCRFEWRNFRSAATPHDEVVYLVDGGVGGLGDSGFDAVLKRLRQLPLGAYLEYPQYCLHGVPYREPARAAFERRTSFRLPTGGRSWRTLSRGGISSRAAIRFSTGPSPNTTTVSTKRSKETGISTASWRFAAIVARWCQACQCGRGRVMDATDR